MFLLNVIDYALQFTLTYKFTIQNVPIKSKPAGSGRKKADPFTIQNVPIKFILFIYFF